MAIHHYVTQGYLKNFSASAGGNQIYAYQRNQLTPILTNVLNVAGEQNFYSFINKFTGEKDDMLEKEFAKLDSVISIINCKLIEGTPILSEDEYFRKLLRFITLLAIRGVAFREKQKNMLLAMNKLQIQFLASNKEAFKNVLVRKLGYKKSDKELEELRQMALNFDKHFTLGMEGGQDYFLKNALLFSADIYKAMLKKDWQILDSEGSKSVFITSDNPITLIPPKQENASKHLGGFLFSSIYIPLSPNRCLLLENYEMNKKLKSANSEKVTQINKYTMFYSHKFIFSNLKSKKIQSSFNKTIEGQSQKTIISSPFGTITSD